MDNKHLSCISNTDPELMQIFRPFALKMEEQSLPPIVINLFKCYFSQMLYGSQGKLNKKEILPVEESELQDLSSISEYREAAAEAISELVVIKLNGGLGTSMGMENAKSLIKVRDGKSFLELIQDQIRVLREKYNTAIPLLFMNSFRTHMDTMLHIKDLENPYHLPMAFLQHKYPKILVDENAPAKWPDNPELEWNPPGHGDIYTALITSGILKNLLDKGYKYAFISNSDNLGATMNEQILGYVKSQEFTFLMEVTARTVSDRKGGHLCRLLKNNRLALREIAQCPENELDEFMDINKYSFFNTNSIWLNLEALEKVFLRHRMVPLDLIINTKTLDPRNSDSPSVYQLETAMGSAISAFDHAGALNVPRDRFAPVKTTGDLLTVMSDCFILSEMNTIIPNPQRKGPTPDVQLDSSYYKKIDQFEKRFSHGAPSLIECEYLKVEGDFSFGRNVTLKGHVTLKNTTGKQVQIEDNSTLEGNKTF
ncbi:UTP--glucose-1-phosphate uridylyltransferase [Desulfonatronovibrio magnus]|uniref:UTP--glucose-1-phosphate uridylyltransferase n=1 Tax=Desulfonatronovibrio magnus TaxID=698827 RepID=UPI0005EAD88E|nr:UTP--glucose-1-phosphate uridylyltransferase [Desulfonatronovibrio magnus]RQD61829.1 MAG: UTP--glucose-1-phosphate uridylyltransferase [Desulfonatronovibrio sp. MSAO_Bac4]